MTGKRTIALDGKTLRGSFDHLNDQKAARVLSASASGAALILAHLEVAGAPGEIPAMPTLIEVLGLTDEASAGRGLRHRRSAGHRVSGSR